jgi:hypothetical protein
LFRSQTSPVVGKWIRAVDDGIHLHSLLELSMLGPQPVPMSEITTALGNLIEKFFSDLPESLFTDEGSAQIIVVQCSKRPDSQKITDYVKICRQLPPVGFQTNKLND